MLVDGDGDWRHGSVLRVAVVIADDEQPAGVQIKAVDMAVGPNQVGSDGVAMAREVRSRAPRASAAVEYGAAVQCAQ